MSTCIIQKLVLVRYTTQSLNSLCSILFILGHASIIGSTKSIFQVYKNPNSGELSSIQLWASFEFLFVYTKLIKHNFKA